jgi:hypothetical protein
MATHADDFEHMRSAIDFAGDTLVNHAHHLGYPGPEHPHNVAARAEYDGFLRSPTVVRADQDVHAHGSTPKNFYTHPQTGRVWMVKPYHESHSGTEHVAHYPMAGWSELTSQALYHAGGIGHLVQHSHATMHPLADEHQPFVAIGFHPTLTNAASKFGSEHLYPESFFGDASKPARPTRMYDDAAKITFMDFLTNHQDRHGSNLLWGWEGHHEPQNLRVLAIDNAGAFQYKAPHQNGAHPKDNRDHLLDYFMHSGGIESLGRSGMGPWDDEHVGHAAAWWQENSPFVRQEFEHHLEAIRDGKVRRHLSKSFNDRADTLDRFAVAFGAAPKLDLYSPWHREPRARGVAEARVFEHQPIFPWAWEGALHPEDHP